MRDEKEMRCTCANCGNDNFETLTVKSFTTRCSVCGHITHNATGVDIKKYLIALCILAVIIVMALCFWKLSSVPFWQIENSRHVWSVLSL